MELFAVIVATLIVAKLLSQLWLEHLNQCSVRRNASSVPDSFRDFIDEPTYKKSVQDTLTKSRFEQAELIFDALVIAIVLFSGLLPWYHKVISHAFGSSVWAEAAFLFSTGVALSLPGLPLNWYSQFRIEQRFGFNTTTTKLWLADRLKGLALAAIIGYPLIVLILKIVGWSGNMWWLIAWAVVLGFELILVVLAPVLIMPLFNKFTPLPEGSLRTRLFQLAERTGFHAKSILVMDGSKRSRHSNAFFTGLKRFRKIVLFDTLMQQLNESELEAVLAHEIGHYKKQHIPKMLAWSAVTLLAGFYCIYLLSRQDWFFTAFGFQAGNVAIALLLFSLLSGVFTFWFSPLGHWWSRRYEYEADAYAAKVMSESNSLINALRKLNEKNLSNLTPHPLYSGFYYSHPTLIEREKALISPTRSSE